MDLPNQVQQMTASELAAKIDEMTLDQIKESAGERDMPTPGGDCDTRKGWGERCGMDHRSNRFKQMWASFEAAGLVEAVRGAVRRGDHTQVHTLYKCPVLAKKIAEDQASKK